MFTILNNLSIRNKIVLMMIFPILGVIYFAADGIINRQGLASEMATVHDLAGVAGKASAVVHETQRERGMVAAFIGSQGREFAAELPSQQGNTDRAISDFRELLQQVDVASFGTGIAAKLDAAVRDFGGLSGHRQGVSSMRLSAAEGIAFYTNINVKLLDMIGELSKSTSHGDVGRQLAAYYNFLQAKERAGIERAVLADTFAAGHFGDGMFARYAGLVAAQQASFDSFMTFASEEARSFYNQKLQGGIVTETERMRRIAFDAAGRGNFGINAQHWFDQQTGKINLLKEVEDHLVAELDAAATSLRSGANAELMLFAVIAAFATGVALLLAYYMTRSIVGPIRQALNALHDIAEGEGDLTRR
ncbi:MAG: nitrate- and nitrite sensing domain-containing protein, partial [Gammaproteobacteria bacterium]|nr:nitrate- and nitrite sensing domain-containing protein [Gammaproteobacteria bacterium]